MDILILALLIISVILLLILLIVMIFKKSDKGNETRLSVISKQLDGVNLRLGEEFKSNRAEFALVQKEMREKTDSQLSDMNERIGKLTISNYEQQTKINETVSVKLTNIQESNEKKLDQMRETVDEKLTKTLSTRLDGSFKQVSEQLENVYKSLGEVKTLSSGVTTNISELNKAISNVKTRGTWAEVQLGNILDQTIPGMYEVNVETVSGSGERVEFAIKVPSDKDGSITYLPIDSKFPLEDYIRLMDAVDNSGKEEVEAMRKTLEKSVETQAKKITKYINVPVTTPFAILYLATEGLYAEIASSREGIVEKLQNKYKIMVAGPSTITALLNSISMGFKTIAINKKADEIARSLAATKMQYGKFSDLLDAAIKKIDEAGKKVGEAQKRSGIIQKKLKKFEDLDSAEAEKMLGIDETNE